MKRIAVLTGGGDAPGLNAVIYSVVHRATHEYGWEVVGSEDGFEGLIQPPRNHKVVELTTQGVKDIVHRGGSVLGCSNVANPWAYPVEKGGTKTYVDMSSGMLRNIRRHGIDAMVLVGGDGTMSMALKLCSMGVPCVGVPKTIDNDLAGTDCTFGFDTARDHATWAIDALHTTAHAHDRVMIAEVMGRHAGWIALHTGIAGKADVILIPEIPYDVERVVRKIRSMGGRYSSYGLIVVAEGARQKGGSISVTKAAGKQVEGIVGHQAKLGGAGDLLRGLLEHRVLHDVRVTVLGHIQRGGSPTPFDRLLALRFGKAAVDLVASGGFGRMVALRTPNIVDVAIEDVVGKPHLVDPGDDLLDVARSLGIELGG